MTDTTANDPTDTAPAPVPQQRYELAKLEAVPEGVMAIIPRTIEEAQRYASGLIRANIVPDAFRVGGKKDAEPDAPLILMGVLKAMEVGLPPQTGLGFLLPLNGRFTIWGDGAVGLVQSKRLIAKHVDRQIGPAFDPATELGNWPPEYGWTVSYWRVGQEEPYVGTFTVRDAKRAGLWMNSYKKPWIQYPNRMLYNRARAFALRDGFADALAGLAIAEEVMDTMRGEPADGGTLTTSHRSALSDEPETEEPKPEPEEPPKDLLDTNF